MIDQERNEKMIRVLCTFERETLAAVDNYAAAFRARNPGVEFGRTTAIRALVIAGVATARLLAGKDSDRAQ